MRSERENERERKRDLNAFLHEQKQVPQSDGKNAQSKVFWFLLSFRAHEKSFLSRNLPIFN